jgi:hypothetical protein
MLCSYPNRWRDVGIRSAAAACDRIGGSGTSAFTDGLSLGPSGVEFALQKMHDGRQLGSLEV